MKKLLLVLLLSLPCWAQNMRFDAVVWGPKGPVPNATVAVCTQPATTTTTPCSPLASLCSSLTDNVCSSPNPVTADSLGNYHFYAKTTVGPYTVQIYGPQVAVPYVLTDQYLNGTITAATLVSPTISAPTITSGVNNNGSGVKHVRISSCTTAASAGATCTTTITWATPFADANYTVTCSVVGATFQAHLANIVYTASTVTPTLEAETANATAGNFHCIAVHD